MIKSLCSYMFFNHEKCKDEAHQETLKLINQIQELKAINDYQAFELEQKIDTLEKENHLLKDKIQVRRKKRSDKLKAKRDRGTIKVISHE